MEYVKNEIVKSHRLVDGPGHYFFGYYDIPAWSRDGRFHLSHLADFSDRPPAENDPVQVGVVDISNNKFIPVATTYAWNFQQGTMLRWNPKAPNDEIIFNIRDSQEFRGTILNINTCQKRMLESAIACVDPMGQNALGISFSRLFDFRPVCGYVGIKDKYCNENHPEEDGIFLIDLKTGSSKLIISLDQIWAVSKVNSPWRDKKIAVNHITFNTDGSRFVFLLRNFPEMGEKWNTSVITANTDGSDIFCLTGYTYASHYYWKDPLHLLLYGEGQNGNQLYMMTDKSHDVSVVDYEFFLKDGHCSYSPDKKWILYDSYPDSDGYRSLYLYNVDGGKGVTLGSYYSDPKITGDIRCDLHPRWNQGGTSISFDSIHEGQRNIYCMDLKDLIPA